MNKEIAYCVVYFGFCVFMNGIFRVGMYNQNRGRGLIMSEFIACILMLCVGCAALALLYIIIGALLPVDYWIDKIEEKRSFISTATFGIFVFLYQKHHPFPTASIISKILNFRTPLSKLLLSIANTITGKLAGVVSDTAFIDYFFTPYYVIHRNENSMILIVISSFFMTAVSAIELYLMVVIFFPELYIVVPIIWYKISTTMKIKKSRKI